MKAVVMAGGEGSRLRPLTLGRPKPLVPIVNRPIMEHIVRLLRRHGFSEIIATLHYQGDRIQAYFGDGSDFGVQITYSTEEMPLGTAGSVKKAEALLRDETFIIISGDALTDCNLADAVAYHKSKGAVATLVLYHVTRPLDFGIVITDPDGKIERFHEKPGWSEVFSDTVNTGIYILEPKIFEYIEPDQNCDWSLDVFPTLLRQGEPLFGYVMEGYWTDIGSHVQYREAQDDALAGKVKLETLASSTDKGISMEGASIVDGSAALVPPVYIGRNCRIKANAVVGPYAVVGDNTVIEDAATVERATLWDSAYIGPNVKVEGALVGSRVTVKRDTVVQEDAVIGDRCLIDVGCVIRPRVKIWPDKAIERGSTVMMSLIWGNKWRGSLFRDLGVAGLSNIEITPDFATRLGSSFGSCLPSRCRVITSRDSTRSSRMLKRAIIASLLSVGCDVLDMRSAAVPVARHFIKSSGGLGAIHVRKLPGNSRVSLIEMFDPRGAYISREMQRKVESAFFREDFNRTDPDDLGALDFASRAIEEYQGDFFRALGGHEKTPIRIVCDYGFSAVAAYYPSMLSRLGVDSISLNGFNDAKQAPRSPADVQRHLANLQQIVRTLEYDMGALFTDEGERLIVVDAGGHVLSGNTLLGAIGLLMARPEEKPTLCIPVTVPSRLEDALRRQGINVIRSKADTPSLMNTSLDAGVDFAADDRGGFIFPNFHPGYDAAFGLAKLVSLLQVYGERLDQVVASVPSFELAYEQVSCAWENKGKVMRRISEEEPEESRMELLDGIKIYGPDGWVLVLPDAFEPVFHVYAEGSDSAETREMVADYAKRIQAFAGG